jgi:hypothetical protein
MISRVARCCANPKSGVHGSIMDSSAMYVKDAGPMRRGSDAPSKEACRTLLPPGHRLVNNAVIMTPARGL